jgi:hypothetical protein
VIVNTEPGPRGGSPTEGVGSNREGNSSTWAFGPISTACDASAQDQDVSRTMPASSFPSVKETEFASVAAQPPGYKNVHFSVFGCIGRAFVGVSAAMMR